MGCGAPDVRVFEPVECDQFSAHQSWLMDHFPDEASRNISNVGVTEVEPGSGFLFTWEDYKTSKTWSAPCMLDGHDFSCSDIQWPDEADESTRFVSIVGTWLTNDSFTAQFTWGGLRNPEAECCGWSFVPWRILSIEAELE